MNIKAYSFEQNSHTFAEVKRTVADAVTLGAVYFESFSDPKALFTDMSEHIDNTDVILIGAEPKVYFKFKSIFIKAFNFTPAYSDAVANAIGDNVSDEKTKKNHTLVPNECTELISKDGLFSGFYIHENEQYIVVFPLLDTVVPEILQTANLPFFSKPEDKEAVFEEISGKKNGSEKSRLLVKKLAENDLKMAVPSTPAARMLKEDVKAYEGYEQNIFFTPFVNDAGIEDPKQYAAQLAKGALELRSADIGATVSNIFREKKGDAVTNYYSFVSVATADKVVVKKLVADPGEDIDNLIVEATNELYTMIEKYVDEIIFKLNSTPEEIEKYEKALIEAELVSDMTAGKKPQKKNKILIILFVILALILSAFIFLHFGGYFTTASDAPEAEVYQNINVKQTESVQTSASTPYNTVVEITDPPFEITTTTTTVEPLTDFNIIYTPNTNTGNENKDTTKDTQKETESTTEKKSDETSKKDDQGSETTENNGVEVEEW